MNLAPTAPAPRRSLAQLGPRLLMPIVLVSALLAFLGGRALTTSQPTAHTAAHVNSQAALEASWGISVKHIAVTAAGGLIDFRYLVLDPDKAKAMLDSPQNVPMLVAEQSGTVIGLGAPPPRPRALEAGRTYYILYPNVRSAVKAGGAVSVIVGDTRLEHVIAQ